MRDIHSRGILRLFLQEDSRYHAWLPQGATDILVLFLSKEEKLAVVNPLTRKILSLSDTEVPPRFRGDTRLRLLVFLKLMVETSTDMKLSLNLIIHPIDLKKFKVIVFRQMR